jgi:predicted glutamine amidotransferase
MKGMNNMCLLSLAVPGAEINYEHLMNGAKQNTDGYGWAMALHKGRNGLLVFRSLDRNKALETFQAARKRHPGCYAMFHARWATSFYKTVDQCHPFQVGSDRLTVLAHNGVFSGLTPKDHKTDPRSDTAVFADEIVPQRFKRLDRLGVQRQFEAAITKSNKVAILTANPRYQDFAYLFNQDMGYWVDGVWHSNSDYKSYRSRYYSTGLWTMDDDWEAPCVYEADGTTSYTSPISGKVYRWRDKRFGCPVCEADMRQTVDLASGVCYDCGFCVDCLEWWDKCGCAGLFDAKRHGLDGKNDDPRGFVISSLKVESGKPAERKALPPGSGSATKYGDGFDGEEDTAVDADPVDDLTDDDMDCVIGDPANADECLFHPVTGWCMSRSCPYLHKLADPDDDDTLPEDTEAAALSTIPADVVADFDAVIAADAERRQPAIPGPRTPDA